MEKGIEQGKLTIATNLLSNSMDVEFISKVTGLSVEEINKLKKK